MEKLPRQVYTREFRQQTVEMMRREGLSIAEASRRLSMSPKTRSLLGQVGEGRKSFTGGKCRCDHASSRGHGRGSRVVAPAPRERGVAHGARHPKKSAPYFASESLRGTQ